MPGFDAAVLAHMADMVAATFDKTCTIQARTLSNSSSGQDEDFTPRASGVPCSLLYSGRMAVERPNAGGVQNVAIWIVRMAATQTVLPTDRILIGSRIFEVLAPIDTSYPTTKQVVCTEVR